MDLETTIALMAASLYDHGSAGTDHDRRRLAVKDARMLLKEVGNTNLYEHVK